MAATSGRSFFLNGLCVSTSVTNAASRAMGVCFPGALAWAVNLTSPLPFSKTPTMAKLPGMPPMGSEMIAPPSSQTRNNSTPRRCSSATSFGAPSPAHSSVHDEARYTSVGGV